MASTCTFRQIVPLDAVVSATLGYQRYADTSECLDIGDERHRLRVRRARMFLFATRTIERLLLSVMIEHSAK